MWVVWCYRKLQLWGQSGVVVSWGCQAWVKMQNGDAACMRAWGGTHIWIGGGVPLEAQNPYLVIFLKVGTHF